MKWWKSEEGKAHEALIPLVKKLAENQNYRSAENLKHVRLYGNLDILGLSSALYARPNPSNIHNRVTLNVIQSCVDTAAAKIAKNRPKPTFLTQGGDWLLQTKAKKLDKFILGQFYEGRTYEESAKCFVDAGVLGTSLIKVFSEDSEVKNERVLVEEILCDDAEALYGKPRSLYQRKPISRDVLREMFPKYASEIDTLRCINDDNGIFSPEHADMVEVVEAWHLRSGKKAKDGRHVMAIENATLLDAPWTRDSFPFAEYRYNPRLVGWTGQGIAEQLVGIQIQINKQLMDITISDHLNSAPAWLLENGSKIVSAHINNEIGHIIKYTGLPPVLQTWATYHPQKAQHLENLYQKAFEIVGISQLAAQSQKPAGLDSGKALREFNDIGTERFAQVGQRWEQFHMDIARLHILEAREIYKYDRDFAVKSRSKKFIETIKWRDVDMSDDKYQMQIFPTSTLPQTPEGRMQYVQEMMTSGLIDPDTGLELLDFPDLENSSNLKFAARNVARETVNLILEDGDYRAPEPFDDLKYLRAYAQMSYNYARIHNAPEERLELMRRLIEQCAQMLGAQTPVPGDMPPMLPPPIDPMAALGGMPGAVVGAPPQAPVAPLLPQVV